MQLSNLDFVLIYLYFVVLIIIGYFASRKSREESYLIAERKLGSFSTMATVNASKTGSVLMIFVALVYVWGMAALWFFIGSMAGTILFIPFALRLKEKSLGKYYTLADYFKHNYGRKTATLASLVSIFIMLGFLVLNLIAGTKIFVFFTGWPFYICAVLLVFIVLWYLLMGVCRAVVKTDILQYIAIVFIVALLAVILFNGSVVPSSYWNFLNVDLVTLVGFFLFGILSLFASPDMWQRVYAAKDNVELKKGLIWSIVFYGFVAFMLALVALTIKANFPNVDPDFALIHGFSNLLPAGLLGLALVLLFAAIMSSIDTYLFTGASAIVQDFFSRMSKKEIVRKIRKTIFIAALFATIIAILIQNLIIGSYLFVSFAVLLSTLVIFTWINPKIKESVLLYGFIIGIFALALYVIYSIIKGSVEPIMAAVAIVSGILGIFIGGIVNLCRS